MSIATICGYFDFNKHFDEWTNSSVSVEMCDAFTVSYWQSKSELEKYATRKSLFFSSLAEAKLWCELHDFAYDECDDHICIIATDHYRLKEIPFATVGTPMP